MILTEREKRVKLAEKLQSWVYEAAEEARRLVKFTNDPEDEHLEECLFGPLESAAMSFDTLIERLNKEADDEPDVKPEPRGYWKTLARTDPRSEAAVEAILAVYRAAMAKTGKPFPANPVVNARKISKDGKRVKACPTGTYEADLPGGPAPERLMDRFNQKLAAGLRKKP